MLAARDFTTGMALALLAKGVRIVAAMANALNGFAPIANQCSALWAEAADRFHATHDQIDVSRLWIDDR